MLVFLPVLAYSNSRAYNIRTNYLTSFIYGTIFLKVNKLRQDFKN
jgi:hypothetical protein